jgi:lysozyme family protein
MNFDQAFERVIGHEGGYVNDPRDPGGETKYGISKRAYPNVDIKNLTLAQAKQIYKRDYWDKCHGDNLPDDVRFDMFDFAVNAGITAAIKVMQRALNVADDGIWGPKTTAAARAAAASPQYLDKRFNGFRLKHYTSLKNFDTFGRGWVNRTADNLIRD